jgi:hypothetical protein
MLVYDNHTFTARPLSAEIPILRPGATMTAPDLVFGVDLSDNRIDRFVVDVFSTKVKFWDPNGRSESDETIITYFINEGCILDNDHDYYAHLDNEYVNTTVGEFSVRRRTTSTGLQALTQSPLRFERFVICRQHVDLCEKLDAMLSDPNIEIVVRKRDRWIGLTAVEFYYAYSSWHGNICLLTDESASDLSVNPGTVYTRHPEWIQVFICMNDQQRFEYVSDLWHNRQQIVLK